MFHGLCLKKSVFKLGRENGHLSKRKSVPCISRKCTGRQMTGWGRPYGEGIASSWSSVVPEGEAGAVRGRGHLVQQMTILWGLVLWPAQRRPGNSGQHCSLGSSRAQLLGPWGAPAPVWLCRWDDCLMLWRKQDCGCSISLVYGNEPFCLSIPF